MLQNYSNIVYIAIFTALQICLVVDGVSQFIMADGHLRAYSTLQRVSGAFAFVAALLGYYCTAHYLCEDALGFAMPMGDTSRWRRRGRVVHSDAETVVK